MKITIKRYRYITKILRIIYLFAVFCCCFIEVQDLPDTSNFDLLSDKFGHFLMFVPLPFLVFLKLRFETPPTSFSRIIFISIVLSILLGIITELGQIYLTATRDGDFYDFMADLAGVLTGILILKVVGTSIETRLRKIIHYE